MPSLASGQDAVGSALTWLAAEQRADGTWAGEPRLAIRDTAEAAVALSVAAPNDPGLVGAVDALAAVASPVVDLEGRRIRALSAFVPAPLLGPATVALSDARAPDGGWGLDGSFEVADALDTALALRALLAAGAVDASTIFEAHGRLIDLQGADGGFASAQGEHSDLVTTAEAIEALADLAPLTDVSAELGAAVTYTLAAQAADGGFPVAPAGSSDVTTTALVLRALRRAGALAPAVDLAAQAFLTSAQQPDGSFESDPYATAVAIQVLGSARPNLAVSEVLLSAAWVTQGQAVQLTARVDNNGVAAAGACTSSVFAGDPATGGTRLGSAPIAALTSGAFAEVAIPIDTSEMLGTVLLYVVVNEDGSVAESSQLDNERVATLDVRAPGDVPPPDNAPPAFTTVPLARATADGAYLYDADAVDPDGEAVSYSLAVAPAGMTVDAGSGLVEWAVPEQAGHYHAILVARDPAGASAAQAYAIEVSAPGEPLAPVFESTPGSVASVGALYEYAISATDPDGGPVTLQLSSGPAGMSLDAVTGTLSWTPAAEQVGEHIVHIDAADDEGATAEQQWIVVVEPVEQGPNLVVVSVDASDAVTEPQSLALSGRAAVTVANHGDAASGETDLVVFEDLDGDETLSAPDRTVGTAPLPALSSRASAVVTVDVAGESLFRDNRLFALADAAGLVAERREGDNVYVSGREARFSPAPGPLRAAIELEWSGADDADLFRQVITNPIVAQLTDDDGDGRAGAGDVPDILFLASSSTLGTIQSAHSAVRAIDGRTGALVLDVAAIPGVVAVQAAASPAVADLDLDGFPEILLPALDAAASHHVVALSHDGSVFWMSQALGYPTGGGAASIADLDGDGAAEVIFGASILEGASGALRCTGEGGGWAVHTTMGPYSVTADLDGDGVQEIVAGKTAYDGRDCHRLWSRADLADGLVAVGQLDGDPEPEIALLTDRSSWGSNLTVLEHTGETKWSMTPPGLSSRGGPPAIGDVDGDGQSEIAVAGYSNLSIIETDGTVRWMAATSDASSGMTSPTIADLDGDGEAEVLYADELRFRIYAGRTGVVLFSADNRSGTLLEYPTVADSDGDGRLEVIVASNQVFYRDWTTPGIRVFGDENWAPGRPLWNQHAYHFTNVRCDQTVPAPERPSWQVFGSYRAQHPIPEDRVLREELRCGVGTVDLSASRLRIGRAGCPDTVPVTVRIGNGGEASAPAGAEVLLRDAPEGAGYAEVARVATSRSLAPGEYEDVVLTAPVGEGQHSLLVEVDPEGAIADGRRPNNVHVFDSYLALHCERNRAPVLTSVPDRTTATVGLVYGYQATAEDPDADALSFSLLVAPGGMSVGPDSGAVLWIPAADQVGDHLVRLQVSDGGGGLDVQDFVVTVAAADLEPPPEPAPEAMALSLAAEPRDVGPGDIVLLRATLDNAGPGGRNGTLTIEILDAQGALVATPFDAAAVLFGGAETMNREASWPVGAAAPGPYLARATYREEGTVLVAMAAVDVAVDRALVAEVATDRAVYGAHEDALVTTRVENVGRNGSFLELELAIEVPGAAEPLLRDVFFPVDLGPGATEERQSVFDTAAHEPGDYVARLSVRDGAETLSVVETPFRIAPSTERGVSLEGSAVCAPAIAEPGDPVTAEALLTNVGNVDLAAALVTARLIDPDGPSAVRESTTALDVALGETVPVALELDTTGLHPGVYGLGLDVTAAGRALIALSDACALEHFDLAPPVILISGVEDGAVYGGPVRPTVEVTDDSPTTVTITLDGVPVVSGEEVSSEGPHVLAVQAVDAAGNSTSATVGFAIDTTPPVIAVRGVADGQCAESFIPVVTFTDDHLATSSLTLDAAPFESGNLVSEEGDHHLAADATDRALNHTSTAVGFVVDATAPEITIDGVIDGGVYAVPVHPVFTAADEHLVELVATLDGAPFTSGSEVAAEGLHVVSVTAVDCAGNAGQSSTGFEIRPAVPTFEIDKSLVAAPARLLVLVEDGRADRADRIDFVEETLASGDVPFVVVGDWPSFFDELRTGLYTAYLLFGDLALADPRREEIREAVALGDGLVTVAVQQGQQPRIEDVWGADLGGNCHDDSRPVAIAASDLGAETTLTILGRSSAARLDDTSATVIGTYQDGRCEDDTALVLSAYGRGRSVLFGFDPSDADELSRPDALSLVASAIDHVTSRQSDVLPDAPVWIQTLVTNLDGAVAAVRTVESFAEVLSVVETDPLANVVPGSVEWAEPFGAGETRPHVYGLALPDTAQTWPTHTDVLVQGVVVTSADLDIVLTRSACDLLAETTDSLHSIDATGCHDHGGIQPVLAHLDAVELCCDGACERAPEDALDELLLATQKLRTVSCPAVPLARLDLDRLIRVLQVEVVR